MKIQLSETEIGQCNDFAKRCAENQQKIEFGQKDTARRSIQEIARDNLIGKIAEVAFAKMLREHYCITVSLDFKIYPRRVWDTEDAVINNWRIDIKATRRGRWLLIEWNKLNFRQIENRLPHLFVMARVAWESKKDFPIGTADLVGCVTLDKLRPDVEHTLVLKKGDCIPKTNTRLQADNYAIELGYLETDWDSIIKKITTVAPPDVGSYPNLYNLNQTTADRRRSQT